MNTDRLRSQRVQTPDDDQWWDSQSGEFVLGTLRGIERDVFERIIKSDSDALKRVDFWRRYFSELDEDIQATMPPEQLLPKILLSINKRDPAIQQSQEQSAENDINDLTSDWSRDLDETLDANNHYSAPKADSSQEQLHRNASIKQASSTRFWKTLSLILIAAVIALSAILLTLFGINQKLIASSQAIGLSIVRDAGQNALWLITLYEDSSQAKVIALAPPAIDPSQRNQLWLELPGDAGAYPLGQLPGFAGESATIELPASANSVEEYGIAAFTVSLEPMEAFPQSQPTGPMLFTGEIQPL